MRLLTLRDRVFALLSLTNIRSLIPVDYSVNIGTVHAYTRITVIRMNQSLDLIRYPPVTTNRDGSIGLSLWYLPG